MSQITCTVCEKKRSIPVEGKIRILYNFGFIFIPPIKHICDSVTSFIRFLKYYSENYDKISVGHTMVNNDETISKSLSADKTCSIFPLVRFLFTQRKICDNDTKITDFALIALTFCQSAVFSIME